MHNLPFTILLDKNFTILKEELVTAINSPSRSFEEISQINIQGLYIVFDDQEIVYVGKTTRLGKFRLREMVTDFRSHTLNKKLLVQHLKSKNIDSVILNSAFKTKLISEGIITSVDFKLCQSEVNKRIRRFKYKFHQMDSLRLTNFEHFAISILQPLYND